ncbi:MAG: penicillin-binding protein 2 [Gemmatimonadetes bacterium]|nr:penicillin-binding protein 2 [Gemmatimonadota bacterium]
MQNDFTHNGIRAHRARILFGVVAFLFAILGIRLYILQIAEWEQYRIKSEKNTMQPVIIQANRGLIRDRNGIILVDNRPAYNISVIPPRFLANIEEDKCNGLLERLGQIVDLPCETITEKLQSHNRHFYDPVKLKLDVDFEAISIIEENRYDFPGVEIQIETRRGYPIFDKSSAISTEFAHAQHNIGKSFPLAPHTLGYVGLINASQYTHLKTQGYGYDDQIGKRGIERIFEDRMRGHKGVKYIEVNAKGREVGSFPEKTDPPIPGEDLWLTLDWRVQHAAEHAFADSMRGSLVAMHPQSGEIIAMVSKPGFHPQSIRDPKAWQHLQTDPSKPLLNRSLKGEYPPASVFKMITSVAALDMGIIKADEYRLRPCTGGMVLGDRRFRCHNKNGCGPVNMRQALVKSCDVFFYQLGLKVGIDNWHRYAAMFGFGELTNIDIALGGDGEARGLLPNRAYYKQRHGFWAGGYMFNLAIGQGELLATPLQVVRYTSALATGQLPTPQVIKGTKGGSTSLPLSKEVIKTVQSMMEDVVNSPYGTGRSARLPNIVVAGKTGTAQNPHGEDHAWFVAYAPVKNPRIAIAVIVENGGSGGKIAAPIAQKTLEAYFEHVVPKSTDELIAVHNQ